MSDAAVVVGCPFCDKQFRILAKNLGAKMKCKGCNQIFVAEDFSDTPVPVPVSKNPKASSKGPPQPKSPEKPEKKPAPQDDDEEEGGKYEVTIEQEVPRCPNCAKELKSENQVICINCGFNNRTRALNRVKRVQHKGFMDYLKWHLYPIFCTIVVIITIVLLILYYVKYWQWAYDNRQEDTIAWLLANQVAQIYIWVAALAIFWRCGKPAVTRFIFHPHPPEEEIFK